MPVINYPTVHLHQPLEDGRHCVYYAPQPGGLSAAIRSALADKGRLERMAAAAREHVMAHHTARARVEYIVRVAIGRNLDGSPVTETVAANVG